ncbi:hypothetical protein CSC80_10605 [Maribacter sp. 6B07]|uniref:hypothetical protein n=1 Tax=Maribacter sp. 6B07 TaxID=2045442 RepID=UPI000C0776C2|nr:hypothetical protein [Maribacter sp. 6B07]PHN93371.1 hypothetical protein CSC80_10605 [Maribacter sp. 6B07]
MHKTDNIYNYEFNFYESFELFNLLEDSIKNIWSQIPIKEREARKFENKLNAKKTNFFSNHEESYLKYKSEFQKIDKELNTLKIKKRSLLEIYIKVANTLFAERAYDLEISKENYNRWRKDLNLD